MVFPLGSKIITLGASHTQSGNGASATDTSNQADSILTWATRDIPAFKHSVWYDSTATPLFRGSNFGIAGDSATMLLSRVPSIIKSAKKQDAKIAVLLIGTNTGSTDFTAAIKKQRIKNIVDNLTSSGLTILLGTILPRAVTGTGFALEEPKSYLQIIQETNTYIKSLAASNVLVWDAWDDLIDKQYTLDDDYYGTPLAEYTTDGVHLTPKGAYQAAISLRSVLQTLVPSLDMWAGTWFNSNPNQSGNRLLDGEFSGTGGTVGSGLTGVLSSNWSASIASPVQVSGVCSLAANANTSGNTTSITLTSLGGGSATGFERATLSPASSRVDEPSMANGKWCRLMFKVRVQNPAGALGSVHATLHNSTTGQYGYGLQYTTANEGNQPFPVGEHNIWIITEAVKYNTSDVFAPSLNIDMLVGTAGFVTVDVDAALLLEYDSPVTDFAYLASPPLKGAALTLNFTELSQLQAMGTSYNPTTYPDGVAGSLEIVDGEMKATIRQTDPPTFTGIRSEVITHSNALGDHQTITWEMKIRSDEWTEDTGQIVIGQLHPADAILAAVGFAIQIERGIIYFDMPKSEPPTESLISNPIPCQNLRKDVWIKMAVRMKCMNNATGYLEFFIDGKQYVKVSNRGTSYNGDAPYFKIGIYDGPHAANFGTKSVRIRNVKVWSGVGSWEETLGQIPEHPQRLVSAK